MLTKKNVLTIATGKELYINMAINLARSFLYWHPNSNINFYFVTDKPELIPQSIVNKLTINLIKTGEFGEGFSPKIHLDKVAPEGQTLFIDSDCLIYGDLTTVFDKFKGHAVSVIGNYIAKGEWFGNIVEICKKYNIEHLPKFNGGVYYLEKGSIANQVYTKARELEKLYDEIGFIRLRGRPNDEVIMALAMQLLNQKPITEDGTIMAEFVNFKSGISSNLVAGKVCLYNTPGHKEYQPNWPLKTAQPLIVHYLGHYNQLHTYLKEVKILTYIFEKKYNIIYSKFVAFCTVTLPLTIKYKTVIALRPFYRLFFGVRNIKKSERIID